MTEKGQAAAQAEVAIKADAHTVYGLITDLQTLASCAEEAAAMKWRKGYRGDSRRGVPGNNRNGVRRWTTTCTVTDADPGSAFAFDVVYLGIPVAHWRYDIAPPRIQRTAAAGSPNRCGTADPAGS